MLKKIRLTSGWRASLKTPSLKLPDSVRPHVNDRKWIFLYSVNSRICGQFEPFRDFFLEPCSSHRPNVSFWNWNSVTQGIYGQVHPDEIVVAHFLATTEIPSSLALCYYSVPQLHEHLNENNYTWGAFFGKIQMRVSESKNGFCGFFLANPKTDHESIKTQGGFFGSNTYPNFWDSQSERFFGKGFEKSIFDKRFFKIKNCAHQKPYMYDILTKPMLVGPY